MFGKLKIIKFCKWIDFGHKDTIYQLKFAGLKFDESRMTRQIHQTLPPAIQYCGYCLSLKASCCAFSLSKLVHN